MPNTAAGVVSGYRNRITLPHIPQVRIDPRELRTPPPAGFERNVEPICAGRGQIIDAVSIRQRLAEIEDRAIPGALVFR